jgi:hypothetical protein
MSNYEKLAAINVNAKIEKKNGLSYLSWAWAVDQLLRADPAATWAYKSPSVFGDTLMVHCEVVAFGKAMTAHLPVMDHRNKAISNPDAFAVNTAMQRCLVKAIALHGLGLYIYAGEDLPEGDEKPKHGAEREGDGKDIRNSATHGMFDSLDIERQNEILDIAHRVTDLYKRKDIAGAWDEFHESTKHMDEIGYGAAWNKLDSFVRSALSKEADKRHKEKEAA